MPTKVIRDNRVYYEYTIQELEEAATQKEIQRQVKFGVKTQKPSPFEQAQSLNPTNKNLCDECRTNKH